MTRLDKTRLPALWHSMASDSGEPAAERTYPGYPRWILPAVRAGIRGPRLYGTLLNRRRADSLGASLPDRATLARILSFSHGVRREHRRGPVPSAGGLQCLELYFVNFCGSWLPTGGYHYGRQHHVLSQIFAGADRSEFEREAVPSLGTVAGGSLVWVITGDRCRVQKRYGDRGAMFLALEAGHLMQNLSLTSTAAGWATVPLGGFYEHALEQRFALPPGDVVLYAGLLGGSE